MINRYEREGLRVCCASHILINNNKRNPKTHCAPSLRATRSRENMECLCAIGGAALLYDEYANILLLS